MRDSKGTELAIGDKVVFVAKSQNSSYIEEGYITKFYINRYGKEECSVGSSTHIASFRIYKL